MSTYALLSRVISRDKKNGMLNETKKEEYKKKMDAYLLFNRITEEEYNQLLELMN